jgi:transposase
MAAKKHLVTGGVDTHGKTHHAAVVDQVGRVLGNQLFPATATGYQALLALLAWLRSFGRVVKVGVEGTGTYGAGLARYLTAEGIDLVEVDRPERSARTPAGQNQDHLPVRHRCPLQRETRPQLGGLQGPLQ